MQWPQKGSKITQVSYVVVPYLVLFAAVLADSFADLLVIGAFF